jgi:hypothetical protein
LAAQVTLIIGDTEGRFESKTVPVTLAAGPVRVLRLSCHSLGKREAREQLEIRVHNNLQVGDGLWARPM